MELACRHNTGSWLFFAQMILQVLARYGALGSNETVAIVMGPMGRDLRPNTFAMFPCTASALPLNHHIVWNHNGNPIFEDVQAIGNVSSRYSIVKAETKSNLAIQQVAIEDHGSNFSCRINNGSLLGGGNPTLVAESRSAMVTVLYGPPAGFPTCLTKPVEKEGRVRVVLSCCTQVVSVPLSVTWMAMGENINWKMARQASTGFEMGQDCLEVDIHSGLNFTAYQCQLRDMQDKLRDFQSSSCRISRLSNLGMTLRMDHKTAEFNCTVKTPGIYEYLWHLQDEDKTNIQQVSTLSLKSSLVLKLNKVSNGSYLYCSVFDKVSGSSMGTTDLKLVLSAPPESEEPPTILIVGVVCGLVVGILICGLSMYFLLIKWKRRNDRLYASLERSSETGMQVVPGRAYVYHKNGVNGNMNGIVTAEGGVIDDENEEVPPKPGGYRTISWEPEDMVIRSNGGVINHSGDRKRRNVEGLVYADLAFQKDEEPDVESDEDSDDTLKGAVGGDVNSSKEETGKPNIQYASIVPPPRSLRF